MNNEIYLPLINFTPTMKCNLKCKYCGVLVPHYDYKPQMTVEEFQKTLDTVFEFVDRVGKLQITGGEPFVYPQLHEIIEYCFKYVARFDKVWIFTNASIPMTQKTEEVLRKYKDKILVHMSDYGVKREIADALVEKMKDIGCEYRYLKYYDKDQYCDGWVDQGDFVKHGRNTEELEEVFMKCSHVDRGGSWYVRNGQMHWCGRSIRGVELNKIPENKEDFLNIFEGTVQERREKLIQLRQKRYIEACDYCNGHYGTTDKSMRHPAGEQM